MHLLMRWPVVTSLVLITIPVLPPIITPEPPPPGVSIPNEPPSAGPPASAPVEPPKKDPPKKDPPQKPPVKKKLGG
jgi:hypothetical protein